MPQGCCSCAGPGSGAGQLTGARYLVLDGSRTRNGARSGVADASERTGSSCCPAVRDPFSPKTVRLPWGPVSAFPSGKWSADPDRPPDRRALPLYATVLRADTEDGQTSRRCAVVIGSEGKGVSIYALVSPV